MQTNDVIESAPRTRGWRAVHALVVSESLVSPAYAGVEGNDLCPESPGTRQPRARGGKGTLYLRAHLGHASAPRMRGFTRTCG